MLTSKMRLMIQRVWPIVVLSLSACVNLEQEMAKEKELQQECEQAGQGSPHCEIVNSDLSIVEKETEMGNLYLFGCGCSEDFMPDYNKANYWMNRAAKHHSPSAYNGLGIINMYGFGKKQDVAAGEKYFIRAHELGNSTGLVNLAASYEQGFGDRGADWSKAERFYQEAIEVNPELAYYGLSRVYYQQKRYEEQRSALEKSANLGYAEADYVLGKMYTEGTGIQRDKAQALYWYQRAATQGHELAELEVKKLKSSD